jgi:hypothetical protein
MLLLLTGVAFSQEGREAGENSNTNLEKRDADASRAAEEQKKRREQDAAYKAALQQMKAPATPTDPWAEVRPANSSPTNR